MTKRSTTGELARGYVGNDEHLLRRFNSSDPAHIDVLSIDEATGAPWLRAGALRFDADGCSVYRVEVLVALGLSHENVMEPPHSELAIAHAGEVRAFRSGFATDESAPEWEVSSAPVPSDSPRGDAHAVIKTLGAYSGRGPKRRAIEQLARRCFKLFNLS